MAAAASSRGALQAAPSRSVRSERRTRALLGFLTMDLPADAELIGKDAVPHGPERFLERHAHSPVFRQCLKRALRIRLIAGLEQYGESPWLFVGIRKSIGSQDGRIAEREPGIEYLRAPLRRCALRQRGVTPCELEADAAAQAAFVELERGLAPPIEAETDIGFQPHHELLSRTNHSPARGSAYWKNGSSLTIQVPGVQPARDFHSRVICA